MDTFLETDTVNPEIHLVITGKWLTANKKDPAINELKKK